MRDTLLEKSRSINHLDPSIHSATNMSSSDGLQRLAEYLAQTRRQADAAIDVLNKRIEELELSNTELKQNEKSLRLERDDFQFQLKLLKAENSTKFQLRERDDWKAVLDSVQKDRIRLSDECEALKRQLEKLQYENGRLQTEMEVNSGKLILGMTRHKELPEDNENIGDTDKIYSTSVKCGAWRTHEEDLNRLKNQLVSRATLLNGASHGNCAVKNVSSGTILNWWYMIFGGDQMEDKNPGILIV